MSMKSLVAGVLLSSQADKIKSFSFNGYTFEPIFYKNLAMYILFTDLFKVKWDKNLNSSAVYKPHKNTIYLGFYTNQGIESNALIIHESTHAVCDMLKKTMPIADAEVMAYVAQCQFAYANNPNADGSRLLGSADPLRDSVWSTAWGIAKVLVDGGTPTASSYTQLRDAISKHPEYASNYMTTAAYDG